MPKITTEDCKNALVQAWPAELQQDYPGESGNWKRMSKKGKKGEPIVRLFYHRALPLEGIVTETAGAISAVRIKGLAPFDLDEESESEGLAETLAMVSTNAAWEFLSKYDLYKPEDFAFFVSDTPDELMAGSSGGYDTWFILAPVSSLKRESGQDDVQLDYVIARHLPEGTGGEVTEATFVSNLPPAQLREELLKLGFVQDPGFDAAYADSQEPAVESQEPAAQ